MGYESGSPSQEGRDEDNVESLELPSEDKDFEAVENHITAIKNASDERSSGRKFEKLPTVDAYPEAISISNVGPSYGPISDIAPATGAPSVIDRDTWVMCDKCQQWRLLPSGSSPKDLPEKWICSMLDWLPGMNRCTFTEAETTQALVALYQVAPESQTNLHGNPGGAIAGVTSANVCHPDQNDKNIGLHFMPSGGKKKDGLKETSDATYKDGPSQLSNLMEKNLQASVKDNGESLELPSENKDFGAVENHITAIKNASDERSSGRKFEKLLTVDAYPKAISISNVGPSYGPISDIAPATGAPSVIDLDTWVMCDKCQKWQLLPFGSSPKDLPEKWICSMLDWLPGMNRCTFTEAETTQALVALYQVAPESQTNLHGNPGSSEV